MYKNCGTKHSVYINNKNNSQLGPQVLGTFTFWLFLTFLHHFVI